MHPDRSNWRDQAAYDYLDDLAARTSAGNACAAIPNISMTTRSSQENPRRGLI